MHTVTGKLNRSASQFQAGESIGFGIRLGVKYRDPKTKQEEWTNYSAVIFAKSPNQIQFYQSALVEGAIVSVGAEQLAVESFDGQNGTVLSISMLNARLTFVHNPNNQQAPQQQGGYGQQQGAPQQNQQHGGYQQQNQQQNQQHGGYQQQPAQQGGHQQQRQATPQNQPQVAHQQGANQAPPIYSFDDDIPL